MIVNIANHGYSIVWDNMYYFALSDYPNISDWEKQKLILFHNYEKSHGRETKIICENEEILKAVDYAIKNPELFLSAQKPEIITECTACKQKGCFTDFLCHTSSIENAKSIFKCGKLLSAVNARNKTGIELAKELRNAAKDPPDFFDYIMFAWGNCQAGDSLVTERNFVTAHGRHPTQAELDEENSKRLVSGVRFYFKHADVLRHPGYVFDGYHAAKVKNELDLDAYLYACIVPEQYRDELESLILPPIANRVYYLSQNKLGLLDWSEKVYNFVKTISV